MARLSTHVLDTWHGRPAANLEIDVYAVKGESRWHLATVTTNSHGRTDAPWLSGETIEVGTYELVFHAGRYFRATEVPLTDPPFLDDIPIRFGIADERGSYHVPLLLGPYSYSTYRGS